MAHFAQLDDDNVVVAVYPVANDALDPANEEASGIEFLIQWSNGYTKWKQCSYNDNIRRRYPAIGNRYDESRDAFILPQPYPSWSLDQYGDWVAPQPKPSSGSWIWDESKGEWVSVTES